MSKRRRSREWFHLGWSLFVATKSFSLTSIPSLGETQASWEMVPSPVHKPSMLIRLLFFLPPKKLYVSPLVEWVTEISIGPNWVVESPCDCLLHFPCFWSIVIHYQDLSAMLFYFVSSKPYEPEPILFLQAHFTVHPSAFRVRIGTLWSLTTEYLLTRRLITVLVWLQLIAQAVSGAVTQQPHSSNLATLKLHWTARFQALAALFTIVRFIWTLLSINFQTSMLRLRGEWLFISPLVF